MHERKRLQTPGSAAAGQAGASGGASSGKSRAVSIEDVATRAGVSTATVSRVLNNPELVASATAQRVQQAISELDYRPNLFAKGLMTRKSQVLGIALPDIYGEFYSELLRGADGEARKLGYHLLVSSEARLHGAENGDTTFAFGLVDGLALMITEPNDALLKSAQRLGVPLVVLDAEEAGAAMDTVVVDNEIGTVEAVKHLLAKTPAERLCFVGGPKENFDSQARARAFVETLRVSGTAAKPDQTAFGEYSMEWGERWAQQRLKSGGLKGLGVLCANDEIAFGVMQVAQDAGVSIPSELKLVGFDDSRLSRLIRPRLSSVRIPAAEVGAASVQALVRRVNDEGLGAKHVKLATTLVARESS